MKLHEKITDRLREFVLAQPVFFVGTAPTSAEGHVNISPKGMSGTFTVLDEHRVAYLDYTASGAETIAHVRQNGRIVLMFCSFGEKPNIVRLHGRGRVVLPNDPEFPDLQGRFMIDPGKGVRAIIDVQVERVSDSCGFAVPRMDYVGDRDVLRRSFERRSEKQLRQYRTDHNARSIDGIPAVPVTE
ncbi:MAG TPA: pyridoxamine 5'-phosphate oxidase family protein [Mycobacteriales bacterium]|nr:pyridoxamine 5'-phosphate oxidase family protein [Mycobacteriales bacterium]